MQLYGRWRSACRAAGSVLEPRTRPHSFRLTSDYTCFPQDPSTDEVRRRLEEQVKNSPSFPPVSRTTRAPASPSTSAAPAPALFAEAPTGAVAATSPPADRSVRRAGSRRTGARRGARAQSTWGRHAGPSMEEELRRAAAAPKAERGMGDGLKTFLRVCWFPCLVYAVGQCW